MCVFIVLATKRSGVEVPTLEFAEIVLFVRNYITAVKSLTCVCARISLWQKLNYARVYMCVCVCFNWDETKCEKVEIVDLLKVAFICETLNI